MNNTNKIACFLITVYIFSFFSCANPSFLEKQQKDLFAILEESNLSNETKFSVINQLASTYKTQGKESDLILFLTDYVENNPSDPYNAYWLLMIAHFYMESEAEKIAEYYFDRIIQNYDDLLVKDKSIHIMSLQNLIKMSDSPENKVSYYTTLISEFSDELNITELYLRLAQEYETIGDWELALKSYASFLNRPDATTIQIAGISDPYNTAKKLVDFSNSPKNQTFETLEALETAIKRAIDTRNFNLLDSYCTNVNFFAMSWKQDGTADNAEKNFSMRDYGLGNRLYYNATLDESSNPNEAYLRTTGWSRYISTWYLYFRKVNFPLDPEIHGRWEWAGIYFGEKI